MKSLLERWVHGKISTSFHWYIDFSIKKVFQAIDADNSGLITPDELREGFSHLGVAVTFEEAVTCSKMW